MSIRQKYTVQVPFPIGGGHWSSVGQQLELLDVEASALRAAGRLELTRVLETRQQAESATPPTPPTKALKAAAKKAE
ncbi:hypothetical protein [Pseudomonas chlororaphis]|uniref:hypothetical protein n=1 Tax=Pseudomonas chlororaphis TaxID=587753 RepID=UPI001B30E153|nr:hypothetical protein [Pseudomonas chlororaphis]QTT90630.1 hypothetical protein HUT28_25605 [Pseudomonas chlororaphis]